MVAASGAYDAAQKGFVVTFTIDEGGRYRLGSVDIRSNVDAVDAAALRGALTMASGDVYDSAAVDKAVRA